MSKNESKNITQIFFISPIGKKETDAYKKYKDVLDYVIKPAVENSKYNLKLLRADEIQKSGSIISEILTQIATSYIVIADLTDNNPNVFYELGVRHTLSPRTILIAQSEKFIPFDLKDYRTIVYDTSAKGASNFANSLDAYLKEIFQSPDSVDNPVLERLPNVYENAVSKGREEYKKMQTQNTHILKKKAEDKKDSFQERLNRLFRIAKLEAQRVSSSHSVSFNNGKLEMNLPGSEGSFQLYWQMRN